LVARASTVLMMGTCVRKIGKAHSARIMSENIFRGPSILASECEWYEGRRRQRGLLQPTSAARVREPILVAESSRASSAASR